MEKVKARPSAASIYRNEQTASKLSHSDMPYMRYINENWTNSHHSICNNQNQSSLTSIPTHLEIKLPCADTSTPKQELSPAESFCDLSLLLEIQANEEVTRTFRRITDKDKVKEESKEQRDTEPRYSRSVTSSPNDKWVTSDGTASRATSLTEAGMMHTDDSRQAGETANAKVGDVRQDLHDQFYRSWLLKKQAIRAYQAKNPSKTITPLELARKQHFEKLKRNQVALARAAENERQARLKKQLRNSANQKHKESIDGKNAAAMGKYGFDLNSGKQEQQRHSKFCKNCQQQCEQYWHNVAAWGFAKWLHWTKKQQAKRLAKIEVEVDIQCGKCKPKSLFSTNFNKYFFSEPVSKMYE